MVTKNIVFDKKDSSNSENQVEIKNDEQARDQHQTIMRKSKEEEKIDREIRILDGLLKLLHATCRCSATTSSNNLTSNTNKITSLQHSTNQTMNKPSIASNNIDDSCVCDYYEKGRSIAASLFAASATSDQMHILLHDLVSKCDYTVLSSNVKSQQQREEEQEMLFDGQINDLAHTFNDEVHEMHGNFNHHLSTCGIQFKIAEICKCVFVSHRKLQIYMDAYNNNKKNQTATTVSDIYSSNSNMPLLVLDEVNLPLCCGASSKCYTQYTKDQDEANKRTTSKQRKMMMSNSSNSYHPVAGLATSTREAIMNKLNSLIASYETATTSTTNSQINSNSSSSTFMFAIVYMNDQVYETRLYASLRTLTRIQLRPLTSSRFEL
jgi:hypothetical protein